MSEELAPETVAEVSPSTLPTEPQALSEPQPLLELQPLVIQIPDLAAVASLSEILSDAAAPLSMSAENSPPPQSPSTLIDYNGRPIPKQTAAGALLTGGFNTHKVYIGNLPDTATLADLEDCFGQLGQCTCSIKRGFGFVDYIDPSSAAEAVAKYHEGHFLGAQIKVELSHARASIPKPADDGKASRNPPGSDRPSDTRKPMHINGPPRGGNARRPENSRGPPPPDYGRREPDRYQQGRPMPPAPGRDAPYPDRYRDDYRGDFRGPPAYPDSRFPPRDFDRYGPPRDARAPPVGYGSGPPPPRDPRDRPYDPYAGEFAPYSSARPAPPSPNYGQPPIDRLPYMNPAPIRDPYAVDRYGPPAFDTSRLPYDSVGDRYDPRPGAPMLQRDDRGSRYDPYARPLSPPRDNGRGGMGPSYGGRSPHRSGSMNDRRRSMSPPRRDPYRNGDFPPQSLGGPIYPPFDRAPPGQGYGPPPPVDRYAPPDEMYNPRR